MFATCVIHYVWALVMRISTVFILLLALSCKPKDQEIKIDFLPGVHVLDSIFMPQFDTYRNIWVYLPPDYDKSNTSYPVLYLQDGQNLFEDSTSFIGEWHIDETMDSLYKLGDSGCILVGIENGQENRLNEYMPHKHEKYGGGQGDAYVNFIISTLKPLIDSTFRTKPEAEFTGIGGSSLGGMISFYAATKHPDVFSKALIFSPSFWIDDQIMDSAKYQSPNICAGHYYFVMGNAEETVEQTKARIKAFKEMLFGLNCHNRLEEIYPPDGQHSEWFWDREFAKAYVWLFNEEMIE